MIVTAPGRQGAAAATLVAALPGRDAPSGARAHGRGRGVARVRGRARPRRRPSSRTRSAWSMSAAARPRWSSGTGERRALGRLGRPRLPQADPARARGRPAVEARARSGARPRAAGALAALPSAARCGARRRRQRPRAREARRADVRRGRRRGRDRDPRPPPVVEGRAGRRHRRASRGDRAGGGAPARGDRPAPRPAPRPRPRRPARGRPRSRSPAGTGARPRPPESRPPFGTRAPREPPSRSQRTCCTTEGKSVGPTPLNRSRTLSPEIATGGQLAARSGHAGRARRAGAWPGAGSLHPGRTGAASPRIAIVGAGLAGLTAAHRLRQAGVSASVYEASDRLGGRCWTIRGAFAEGQVAEHGGELIDSGHLEMRTSPRSWGSTSTTCPGRGERNGAAYYFDGAPYTYDEATNDFKTIWQQLHKDLSAASYPTTYTSRPSAAGSSTGCRSPGGSTRRARAARLEARAAARRRLQHRVRRRVSDQSALNLLYLLGYVGQGQLRSSASPNEKFHVRGGNDQVVAGWPAALAGRSRPGGARRHPRDGAGSYTLTFERVDARHGHGRPASCSRCRSRSCEHPSTGRRPASAPSRRRAIRELGMGTNSKLHLGFTDRHWRTLGSNGDTYSDRATRARGRSRAPSPARPGILVDYTGGTIGASFGKGTPTAARAAVPHAARAGAAGDHRAVERACDARLLDRRTSGRAGRTRTGRSASTRASAGVEGERSGNCHFAGEHTSVDFQGYLNGAVETGERAAAEILGDLR